MRRYLGYFAVALGASATMCVCCSSGAFVQAPPIEAVAQKKAHGSNEGLVRHSQGQRPEAVVDPSPQPLGQK